MTVTYDVPILFPEKVKDLAYVAGPMTNIENFNFHTFDAVTDRCRVVDGWGVLNPHEHDQEMYPGIDDAPATQLGDVLAIAHEVGFDFHKAMVWDLQSVAIAEHLVLLPGWENSTGAKAERFVGEMTGSKIWLASKGVRTVHLNVTVDGVETWYASEWYLTLDSEQKRLSGPQLEVTG